jgi:membrane fusion protein, multidrug efflux system
MKLKTSWVIAGLVLLLVAGGMTVLAKRKATTAEPNAATATKAESAIELAAGDVITLQSITLSQGVPISGSLKAGSTALVKAKVAGELQGLALREGDAVRAGQLIARIDSTEYAARVRQAKEQADAAKAQIDISQRQFDNNKALVDQGFISRTALDTSQASLQSAQANHKAALAALEVAQKSVQDTQVTAPISGIVAQRLAQPGERVGVDARIVEIVDLSRIELEAALAPSDSLDVRVGQTARLKVEGRSDEVQASVVRISPSASAGSRSVLVYLSVAALPGLRQGLFAQGTLDTQRVQAVAAPLAAVRLDKPQPYVQLVKEGRIVHQTVELGARGESAGQTAVTLVNVPAGSMLTLASAGQLRDGTLVKVIEKPTAKTATNAANKAAPQ